MRKRLILLTLAALLLIVALPLSAQDGDIVIEFPPSAFVVSGTVEVLGAINVPNLQSYLLEVAEGEGADVTWIPVTLPSRTPPATDVIAEWDTTILTDGVYRLRVRVVTSSGASVTAEVADVRVSNEGGAAAPVATTSGGSLALATNTPQRGAIGSIVIPTSVPTPEGPVIIARPDVTNPLPIPVGGQMDTMDAEVAALMREAGMTWMKWQIPYTIGDASLLDVARDRINFSHENGFFAFISLKGSKDELAAVGAEEYYPLYAEFAGQIAALQPDAIQIWNEMNIDREWPNGQIDPVSYTELLRQSYEAIKAVDPVIRVVTGAPAPTGAEGAFGLDAVWNDDRYYLGMANAGAGDYSDCIGIHYNEGILPPNAQGGDPRGEYPTRYFPSMLQRAAYPFTLNGRTGESLCFSEMGYLSPDGYGTLPQGFEWGANNSVQEQAAWLRDAVRIAAETSSVQVDLIIVFNVNYTRFVDNDPQGGFAIIRPDGSCPACDAIAELRNDR